MRFSIKYLIYLLIYSDFSFKGSLVVPEPEPEEDTDTEEYSTPGLSSDEVMEVETNPNMPEEKRLLEDRIVEQHLIEELEGLNHGPYTSYYMGTNIKFEEGFRLDGYLEGPCTSYFKDGSVENITHFQKGVPHGDMQIFSKMGIILFDCSYFEGKMNGPYTCRYMDGRLKSQGFYNMGVCEETTLLWDEEGKLTRIEHPPIVKVPLEKQFSQTELKTN